MSELRQDLQIIERWIKPNSQVLDLGCGEGLLLKHLKENKMCAVMALKSILKNYQCIANGLNVIEQDLDKGLNNFKSDSMNTVIMTQAAKRWHARFNDRRNAAHWRRSHSHLPNFGYWRIRFI